MALNWGGSAAGALGGASTGATIGSVIPGVGTAIGAGVGAIGGFLAGLLSGNPEAIEQYENLAPEQKNAIMQTLQSGMQQLQNPYEGFEPIRQSALNTFHQDIVPGLTNMFQGRGSSSYSSPQLQTNLSSAGAGLAQRLAAAQAQYGQQNQQNALQQIQLGLSPLQGQMHRPGTPGYGPQLLNSSISSFPSFLQGQQMQAQNTSLQNSIDQLLKAQAGRA